MKFFGEDPSVFSILSTLATVVLAIISVILTDKYGKSQSELIELQRITKSMAVIAEENNVSNKKRDKSIDLLQNQFRELKEISSSSEQTLQILTREQSVRNKLDRDLAKPALFLDPDAIVNIRPNKEHQKKYYLKFSNLGGTAYNVKNYSIRNQSDQLDIALPSTIPRNAAFEIVLSKIESNINYVSNFEFKDSFGRAYKQKLRLKEDQKGFTYELEPMKMQ